MSQGKKAEHRLQNRDPHVIKDRPVCRHGKKTGEHTGRGTENKIVQDPDAWPDFPGKQRTEPEIRPGRQKSVCGSAVPVPDTGTGQGETEDLLPGSTPVPAQKKRSDIMKFHPLHLRSPVRHFILYPHTSDHFRPSISSPSHFQESSTIH